MSWLEKHITIFNIYVYYSKQWRRKISNEITLTKQFLNRIILYLKGIKANAIFKTFTKMNQPCKCVQLHFQYTNALISGAYTNHDRPNGHSGLPCKQLSISRNSILAESRNSLAVIRSDSKIPSVM